MVHKGKAPPKAPPPEVLAELARAAASVAAQEAAGTIYHYCCLSAAAAAVPAQPTGGRPVGRGAAAETTPGAPTHLVSEPTPAPTPSFTLEELDVESDSTCRSQRCRCHFCKQALRRQLGVRPTLQSRAKDNGLDMDTPGWICDLRGMGEISDDEWAELMGGWEHSSSDSQPEAPEPEAATSAPPEPYCS